MSSYEFAHRAGRGTALSAAEVWEGYSTFLAQQIYVNAYQASVSNPQRAPVEDFFMSLLAAAPHNMKDNKSSFDEFLLNVVTYFRAVYPDEVGAMSDSKLKRCIVKAYVAPQTVDAMSEVDLRKYLFSCLHQVCARCYDRVQHDPETVKMVLGQNEDAIDNMREVFNKENLARHLELSRILATRGHVQYDAEHDQAATMITGLRGDMHRLRGERESMRQRAEKAEADAAALRREIQLIRQTSANFERQYKHALDVNSELMSCAQTQVGENRRLAREVDYLRRTNAELASDTRTLVTSQRELQAEVESVISRSEIMPEDSVSVRGDRPIGYAAAQRPKTGGLDSFLVRSSSPDPDPEPEPEPMPEPSSGEKTDDPGDDDDAISRLMSSFEVESGVNRFAQMIEE